jgi:hypothetical protein
MAQVRLASTCEALSSNPIATKKKKKKQYHSKTISTTAT